MSLIKAVEFTKRWYSAINLERQSVDNIVRLCANSLLLSKYIVGDSYKIKVEVVTKVEGATYVVRSGYEDAGVEDIVSIIIPAFYFLPEYLKEIAEYYEMSLGSNNEFANYMAITLFNGSQIHESLHVKHTGHESDISEIFKGIERISPKNYKIFKNYPAVVSLLFNIIEDVYIEKHANKANYSTTFLRHKNNLFFPAGMLGKALADADDPIDYLKMLAFLKNFDLQEAELFGDLEEIAQDVLDVNNQMVRDRADATVEIFKKFIEKFDMDTEPGEDNFDEDGENELARRINSSIEWDDSYSNEISAQAEQAVNQLISQIFGKDPIDFCEGEHAHQYGKSTILIDGIMSKEMEKIEAKKRLQSLRQRAPRRDIDKEEVTYFDIINHPRKQSVELIEDFKGFGKMLYNFREEKTTYGMPLNRGAKIVKQRIWRISTDTKIFSHNHRTKIKTGNPEVIFLIDMSGSMSGGLFDDCVDNAASAFIELMNARISCAVYGHTGVSNHHDKPLIVSIASNNMPLGNVNSSTKNYMDRFERLKAYPFLNENYDGVAIREVSKFFTKKVNSKILIVFSDGSPSGNDYRGRHAIEHTRDNIDVVRAKGINVISMSLTEFVSKRNSELYGNNNNVDGYGIYLSRNLKTTIENIALNNMGGRR